jgi:hypothetical protein
MTRYPSLQAQRARRLLNQEAVKRSHRRGDLIRLTPEDEPTASTPHSVDDPEQADEPALTPPPLS